MTPPPPPPKKKGSDHTGLVHNRLTADLVHLPFTNVAYLIACPAKNKCRNNVVPVDKKGSYMSARHVLLNY